MMECVADNANLFAVTATLIISLGLISFGACIYLVARAFCK